MLHTARWNATYSRYAGKNINSAYAQHGLIDYNIYSRYKGDKNTPKIYEVKWYK